jgi:hypothetical protein
MPLYFFHLDFGGRRLPDEDGLELPNRAAARREAQAAIRELAAGAPEEAARRWAGWFVQVADEKEAFLRLPIAEPALEFVGTERQPQTEQPVKIVPTRRDGDRGRGATMLDAVAVRLKCSELLAKQGELREQLSAELLVSKERCFHARMLVARARLGMAVENAAESSPPKRPPGGFRPELVVLPGGA